MGTRIYFVDDIEMTGKELIEFAEQQYGCQANECMKFTSIAANELRQHGLEIREK